MIYDGLLLWVADSWTYPMSQWVSPATSGFSGGKSGEWQQIPGSYGWSWRNATCSPQDEFEAKQKELEGVVNPIMMKVYQAPPEATGDGSTVNSKR